MEPFLGQIQAFGFNFAPRGWAQCQGQLLAINTNTALFSLLGTTYGGNGQTTFALPDFRGRTMVGQGQGPGLSAYTIGQVGGTE
jgi:microcystin-dependent protein